MIYIVWAPPRQGKSYCVTADVVDMIIANKRDVFTNYPVVIKLKDGEYYSSLIWKPEYVHEAIACATIVIDEAYTDFSSREYKKFQIDTHSFFATNGHNDIDIYLIAQNPARIDLIIREMCSGFIYVKKTAVPYFVWVVYCEIMNRIWKKNLDPSRPRPLYFTQYTYLTEKQMSAMKPDDAWQIRRLWFDEKAASAYDTHYYRSGKKPFEGDSWLSQMNVPEIVDMPTTKPIKDKINDFIIVYRRTIKEKGMEFEKSCRLKWISCMMNRLNREMKFPSCVERLTGLLALLRSRLTNSTN